MGIRDYFSGLFSKRNPADTVYPGTWVPMGGVDGVTERNLLLKNKEWVFIAVDRVAEAVASAPFCVKRYRRNGDDQVVFDGPLVEFLEKPGKELTGKDFIYLNTVYKELTGNAFWERETKSKLRPLIPSNVTPTISRGQVTGFKYTEDGNVRNIAVKDVLHDFYANPAMPYWGAGKLQRIARWVDTSTFANEFLRRFFINGATFGGFIETEEESEDRIKLIKAGLANDHVGVENAHKTGVLPKGSKYTRVTGNMQEVQMGETDDRYRDKILAGFGVPKTLVGLTTEVNRASAEAAEYVFAQHTVKPAVIDLLEFLNVKIAPLLDPTGQTYFDVDEFVPVNMEIALKEREIALNRQPYKTVNEVRAEQGLPPVPGGDVVYGPPFQTPLGTPSPAPYSPPEPSQDDDEDEDDDEPVPPQKSRSRAVQARVRRFARQQQTEEAKNGVIDKLAEVITTAANEDEMAWKSFVGRVESYTDQLADRVRRFNDRQRQDIINRLNTITGVNPNQKAVKNDDLFGDMDNEVAAMVDVVKPLLTGLMIEQAIAEYQANGFEGVFDSGADMLSKTVAKAAKRLGTSYNDTTVKLLKTALNEGINAGDGLPELTERVNQVFDYGNEVRAKMVAHTESFYIANEGSKEAYRQSGVVKTLRWYTAEDERVCPWCEPVNGTIIDVDADFFPKGHTLVGSDGRPLQLNYRAINVPPLHTNCRCFVRPETITIED